MTPENRNLCNPAFSDSTCQPCPWRSVTLWKRGSSTSYEKGRAKYAATPYMHAFEAVLRIELPPMPRNAGKEHLPVHSPVENRSETAATRAFRVFLFLCDHRSGCATTYTAQICKDVQVYSICTPSIHAQLDRIHIDADFLELPFPVLDHRLDYFANVAVERATQENAQPISDVLEQDLEPDRRPL